MDKNKEERLQKIVEQIADLNLEDIIVLRETLSGTLRKTGLARLNARIKALRHKPSKEWRNREELGFLLTTSTQDQDEGEGVVRYLQFTRSIYIQLFTEFTECGTLLEDLRKRLELEKDVNLATMHSFWKLGKKLYDTLNKAYAAKEYLDSPFHEWKRLHGHTPEQFSKLMKKWDKLKDKMRKSTEQ